MFTGLVRDIGAVAKIETGPGDARYIIQTRLDTESMALGASVCCSGCCLSVVEKGGNWFAVDVSGETLSKTCLGTWMQGTLVNLEPSLKVGDELGGHFVSGHVDGLATLIAIKPEGGSHRLTIEVPQAYARFIAPKGSIALDGVSLTVNEVNGPRFGVNIIPHTWTHTTLGALKNGEKMHFEIDMLARYVARQLQT